MKLRNKDKSRTVFRTRYSHYESLARLFRFINATATFKEIMNRVFKQCLDEFVVMLI